MVLEKLGSSLQDSVKKLLRLSVVDEETVKELVKDLQRALLQSDVNVHIVLDLSKRIENRALNEKLPPGLSRKEHLVKVVYDELTKLLGKTPAKIPVKTGKSNIMMLVGIQGSGKTTTAVKIARFLKKRGMKTTIVCTDTYRLGAFAQLKQLAATAGIPVYGDDNLKDPLKIAKLGIEKFQEEMSDVVILDTAGRHKDEISMIEEMKDLAKAFNPDHIMLVVDGCIGQQAFVQAKAFNEATGIGSIVVTKLDGSARGGGALSAVAAINAPITFIGTGEKIEDIELFDPSRFVGRLLGMGDIQGLLEKAKEAEVTVPEKKVKTILSGRFSLMELYEEIERVRKLGPLGKIFKMIPSLSFQVDDSMMQLTEEKIQSWKAIIQSMTKEERENPKILNSTRIKRVARGSGRSEKEVKELLQQFELTKKIMKSLKRRQAPFKIFDRKMFRETAI